MTLYLVVPVDPAPLTESGLVLTVPLATLIVGTLLPIVTALVTKSGASSTVKGVVAIVLAAVATVCRRVIDGGEDLALDGALVGEFLLTVIVQVAMYLGFWQPVVDVNSRTAPSFGLGKAA